MRTQIIGWFYRALTRSRVAWWRSRGIDLAPGTRIDRAVDFARGVANSRPGSITAGPDCHFSQGVLIHAYGGNITLGGKIFLGPYAVIYGHGGVTIGDDCLISMHCRILSSNHTVPPVARRIRWEPDELRPTRLGCDVWLGAGVTVLGGVTIGDGCVVGAGAVVTKDLPAGAIAHGIPAVVKGYRDGANPAAPPS